MKTKTKTPEAPRTLSLAERLMVVECCARTDVRTSGAELDRAERDVLRAMELIAAQKSAGRETGAWDWRNLASRVEQVLEARAKVEAYQQRLSTVSGIIEAHAAECAAMAQTVGGSCRPSVPVAGGELDPHDVLCSNCGQGERLPGSAKCAHCGPADGEEQ